MYVCSVVSDWVSVDLTESPWTVAYQAPLFMGFPRLKNTGVGCHFLLQGLFPGMEPVSLASPALVGRFFTTEPLGKPPTVLLQSKQLVVDCFLIIILLQFSSVQFSNSVVSDSLRPHESQHTRPPCPSPSPGVRSNSRPSSQWCHPAISSSVVPFSSCPQCLPESESFPMSKLFAWSAQSSGVSALVSFLPKKSQGWSSEWTGWISLQSKGLSRVFSNTTVQKHQFFGAQPSSQSNSCIHTWLLEKP